MDRDSWRGRHDGSLANLWQHRVLRSVEWPARSYCDAGHIDRLPVADVSASIAGCRMLLTYLQL